MKFRAFIWISGIALVMLIPVQYYFISETFRTKQQQFDSRYSGLTRLGLYEFESRYIDTKEDSVFMSLDDYAYFAIHDLGFSVSPEMQDSIRKEIILEFDHKMNLTTNREEFLKTYLSEEGENVRFSSLVVIRELYLLSPGGRISIFSDSTGEAPGIYTEGYMLNSYHVERNYFSVSYDYFILFPERAERIRNEMRLTISLSFATLLIVFGVFFLTLRNLLIQKRLSELKTDFINNMTHELKTPLSTISVASSSLAKNEGELKRERITELSGIIIKQNRHLSKLIDRILDISIWEKDEVKLEKTPTGIHAFLSDILEDFQATHPGIRMKVNLSKLDTSFEIPVDRIHMHTVINNLLSNAFKYGGDPPTIEVSARTGDALYIDVRDNGRGIHDAEKDHLFEKFFRGRETRQKAIRGLGLGLYYVKKIVEAHEGSISFDSNGEQGTIFTIEIPF